MNNLSIKMSGCIVTYNNASIIDECVSSILKWTQNLNFTLYITAKKFLAMGLSIEQVAQGTGLTVDEVKSLAK